MSVSWNSAKKLSIDRVQQPKQYSLEFLYVCVQQVVVLQQQIQLQQNETDKLRSDNVKLYEKIKFLQGYSGAKVTYLLSSVYTCHCYQNMV